MNLTNKPMSKANRLFAVFAMPIIMLVLLILLPFTSLGKEETYVPIPGIQTINVIPLISEVVDVEYAQNKYDANWDPDDFYNQNVVNKIILNIDRNNLRYINAAVSLDITLNIEQVTVSGSTTTPQAAFTKTVQLVYDPAQTALETDQVVLSYDDVVKSKVTVTAVAVTGSALTYPHIDLPQIQINNLIHIERARGISFDPMALPFLSIVKKDKHNPGDEQLIEMTWMNNNDAEAYEVEFQFIANPTNLNPGAALPTNIDVDFLHNATRIRVENTNQLVVPAVLPEGILVFRVRTVGLKLQDEVEEKYSLWTLPDFATFNVSTYLTIFCHSTDNFDQDRNWNVSVSYAEDTKHGLSLEWFDGMLRLRETLVMDNSTGLPTITAAIFDHQGRETVKAMPSPFFDEKGYAFRSKVNQNSAGQQYGPGDFDYNQTVSNSPTLPPVVKKNILVGEMSDNTNAGANYYYSDKFNTYLQTSSYSEDVQRRHSFLPDANGYAFSQVELTNDGTGRVARSGSVGEIHQLTSFRDVNSNTEIEGKEIKTWDGTPFQAELDRLFATEVGPYHNYKKVMTQDQNGQISIAYMDLFGRTVATALAGDPNEITNLDPITSSAYSTPYNIEIENTSSGSTVRKINHAFVVSEAKDYDFTYDFTPQEVDFVCDEFCYSCTYDLTIDILDQWGESVLDNGAITMYIGTVQGELVCGNPATFTLQPNPLTVPLSPGEYTIVKTLSLNEKDMVANRELYLEQSGCIKPFVEFLAEELDAMDIACEMTCEQCETELADLVHIKDSIEQWCSTNQIDPNTHDPFVRVELEYNEVKDACDEICEETSPCDILYKQMISDVSLGGQYMQFMDVDEYGNPKAGGLANVSSSILKDTWWDCQEAANRNWRTPKYPDGTLYYKNADGTESLIPVIDNNPAIKTGESYVVIDGEQFIKPHQLENVLDFIDNWKNSWGEALVYMHPEYCYYDKCLSLEPSYAYDAKLMATTSGREAQENGYFNPLAMSTLGTIDFPINGVLPIDYSSYEVTAQIERDPITQHSFYGSASTSLSSLLTSHSYKEPDLNNPGQCKTTTETIWELYEQYRMEQGITSNIFNQDTCIEDVFWPVLRGLYLSIKQEWLKDYYENECPDGSLCANQVPQSLINIPRWYGVLDISMLSQVDSDLSGLSNLCDPKEANTKVQGEIDDICSDNCDYNVDLWLDWLSSCSKISQLADEEPVTYIEFKDALKQLCLSGCDIDHPYGSISRSPKNWFDPAYPHADLHDIFVEYWPNGWYEEGICDDLLIQFPGNYGHDYLSTNDPQANECACDTVKWHTSTSCPDLIVRDTTGAEPCECGYPHDLMMAKTHLRKVYDSEKCQNCIVCKDLIDPVNVFFERYDLTQENLNDPLYKNLLTTHLNRYFGFNLTYREYAGFAYECGDSSTDTTWVQVWENIGMNRMVAFNDGIHIDNHPTNNIHRHVEGNAEWAVEDGKLRMHVPDLSTFVRAGLANRPISQELASTSEGLLMAPAPHAVQADDPDNVECNCKRILEVDYMIANGLSDPGLTPEEVYDQLNAPDGWPTTWNFDDLKNICCQLWNQTPFLDPNIPCVPGDPNAAPPIPPYMPGMNYPTGSKLNIINQQAHPLLDPFEDPPSFCDPESVNAEEDYMDTCGCKELALIKQEATSLGIPPRQHAINKHGVDIPDFDALHDICKKMWSTAIKKDANGDPISTYDHTSTWSKINTGNLGEYSFDMNHKLPLEILCGPSTECLDDFPCAALTKHFMRLQNDLLAEDLIIGGTNHGPLYTHIPDFDLYADVSQQMGQTYDILDDIDMAEQLGNFEWEAKLQFINRLTEELNDLFALCDDPGAYSIELYLHMLRQCYPKYGGPGKVGKTPCLEHLDCDEVGEAFKDFISIPGNEWPGNAGYGPPALKTYAHDLGEEYDANYPIDGTGPLNHHNWFAAMENFFNERFNKCYDETKPESKLPLGDFLQWTYQCNPGSGYKYKADPCPKCYVSDTIYLEAFRGFLDQVTQKPNPNYLHQSLWPINGNPPRDITSFHANPVLYNNNHSADLEYVLNEVKVPELDVVISDDNGYTLEFNLLFPSNEKRWNFGEIKSFNKIYPVKSGGCNPPNLFAVEVEYKLPEKYWGSNPDCPNGLNECTETVVLQGRFKNIHAGIEVSCLGCNRLCNKPFFRPQPKQERCHDRDVKLAIENALERYNDHIIEQMEAFDAAYVASCLDDDAINEEFRVAYEDRSYHHTLYHYDRAGNLVKTVPPSGVDIETDDPNFGMANRLLLISDRINKTKAYRENNSNPKPIVYHSLITQYKYNTVGELVWQETPDGGIAQSWYDVLARPVLSQNAKEATTDLYSYMDYDPLGRAKESGQIDPLGSPSVTPKNTATISWLSSLLAQGTKTEVTATQYNEGANTSRVSSVFADLGGQQNLRNVVASVTYELIDDNDETTYDQASYYTYDPLGNVNRLVQDIPALDPLERNLFTIDYEYDLLSGNVNKAIYQNDKSDQFVHKYSYDEMNRLYQVYTSEDDYSWQRDGQYEYYLHGPLARLELGELNVQGMDFIHNLNGQIKAVNGSVLDQTRDLGRDGDITIPALQNGHYYVARDAFAFDLSYYDGDYQPIHNGSYGIDKSGSSAATKYASLYNGNIAMMTTAIPNKTDYLNGTMVGSIMGNVYRYDQLNRITKHRVYQDINTTQTAWLPGTFAGDDVYYEDFVYDANGNITALTRHGHKVAVPVMDQLDYSYDRRSKTVFVDDPYNPGSQLTLSFDLLKSNKLYHVADNQSNNGRYTEDIDDPGTIFTSNPTTINSANPYSYDELGNLIKDGSNGTEIGIIEWTVTGKIKSITRDGTYTGDLPDLEFGYDAMDNRLYKLTKPRIAGVLQNEVTWTKEYYIYDGSGALIATYTQSYQENGGNYTNHLHLNQQMMYGAKRLGVLVKNEEQVNRQFATTGFSGTHEFTDVDYSSFNLEVVATYQSEISYTHHGQKQYELANHLGNVLVTIQDRKRGIDQAGIGNPNEIDYYIPYVISTQDYYAFGSIMEERGFDEGSYLSTSYRFGFNGMEREKGINSNSYATKYRIFDPRLGRWFSLDPLAHVQPYLSPFQSMANNPVQFADPTGAIQDGWRNAEGDIIYNDVDGTAGSMIVYDHSLYFWVGDENYISPNLDANENYKFRQERLNFFIETNRPFNREIENDWYNTWPTPLRNTTANRGYPSAHHMIMPNRSEEGSADHLVSYPTSIPGLVNAGSCGSDICYIWGPLRADILDEANAKQFQWDVLMSIWNDPRYGSEAFSYLGDWDNITLGAEKFGLDGAFRSPTWSMNHTNIKFLAQVDASGEVHFRFKLYDILDLKPESNRSIGYNIVTGVLGGVYHGMLDGNYNLQTRAAFNFTAKPILVISQE